MANIISLSTKNTVFEEVFNFLTYESSSTKIESLRLFLKPEGDPMNKGIGFSAIRIISYPNLTVMARNFVEGFPENIEIKVKGYIDETGHARITTSLPEIYQKYVYGKEVIDFYPDGRIKVSLKYHIVPANEEGIMGSFRNGVYNGMTEKIESYLIELYKEKRKNLFNNEVVNKIKDLEELKNRLKIILS